MIRTRRIKTKEACGGQPCIGPTNETVPCNTQCCPVHCSWGQWNKVTDCSKTCGNGVMRYVRTLQIPQSCGGSPCLGKSNKTIECNERCCPVDCVWGDWENKTCSASCEGGEMIRTRRIKTKEACGGQPCIGPTNETVPCNTQCCPVHCSWGQWNKVTDCSKTCGNGVMRYVRTWQIPQSCGGSPCLGKSNKFVECNESCCPVDCVFTQWSSFGSCQRNCKTGYRYRRRKIETKSSCGGRHCMRKKVDRQECPKKKCPKRCTWGNWSECSRECGGGKRFRVYKSPCPLSKRDIRACNTQCCPKNCIWAQWSEWSSCNKSCGGGEQIRFRRKNQELECGGKDCEGNKNQSKPCNTQCCPVDCKMSEWESWGGCSATCGASGTSIRSRTIIRDAICNGTKCDKVLKQQKSCNQICFNGKLNKTSDTCDCSKGWKGSCCDQDVDECQIGNHNCNEVANCTNNDGSYNCKCLPGFHGDGVTCQNVNECLKDEVCGTNEKCVDNFGSYTCICLNGYFKDENICKDVDECLSGGHNCSTNAYCNNTKGRFECICNKGFEGNGTICEELEAKFSSTMKITISILTIIIGVFVFGLLLVFYFRQKLRKCSYEVNGQEEVEDTNENQKENIQLTAMQDDVKKLN